MNIRWDYFVNQYDAARYVSTADGRDNRHIQFVREFASVISVLQEQPFRLTFKMTPYLLGFRTKPIASATYTRISSGPSRIWRRVPARQRLFQNSLAESRRRYVYQCHAVDGYSAYCLDRSPQPGRICQPRAVGCSIG